MRQREAAVSDLIGPAITGLGYELWGIEYLPAGDRSVLRIYIESDAGITVDDCARVSHQVSGVLDVEDPIKGRYTLEVSSPGADRLLFVPGQFDRYIGHGVRLKLRRMLDGRRKLKGVLVGREHDDIVVELDGEQIHVALSEIDKARLVPE